MQSRWINMITASHGRGSGRPGALLLAAALLIAGLPPRAGIFSGQVLPAQTSPAQSPAAPQTGAQPTGPPDTAQPENSKSQVASRLPAATHSFFVMIDPGHGGEDAGARLGCGQPEKEMTLALARRLKTVLVERGIPARLLRESDTGMSLDERAEISNEQHAAVFISLHAGTPGSGVRVYAPALASPPSINGSRFLPWESAQTQFMPRSRSLAGVVAAEIKRRRMAVASMALPLRPLNNVAAYAIAVELVEDDERPCEMTGAKSQSGVAGAIAAAVAQMRSQLEGQP